MTTGNDMLADEELLYTHVETLHEVESRLFYENDALERKMLADVTGSGMNEPTYSYCLFSVQIAQLDHQLNEYYDAAAILSSQTNPMTKEMLDSTPEQQKIWSYKDGRIKGFKNLSLGQKHQALLLVQFLTQEDAKKNKRMMAKLDDLVALRNKIVHSIFDPKVSNEDKLKLLSNANKKCSELSVYLDLLHGVFTGYIFNHLAEYYSVK